jgi:OOP family OmpA-OmpF porin
MNKHLSALLAIAALASPAAYADETPTSYAGVALAVGGRATGIARTGQSISENAGVGARLYGGLNFNENVALEAGYGHFGSITLKNTGPGTSGDARIETSVLYVAGKGTYVIDERFALFGKLGVARTRFALSGFGTPDVTMTRPMFGVGAQYNMTPRLALTFEVNRYGKTQTAPNRRFNLNKVDAGLTFSF